jgi:hypothetical protein
VLSPLYTLLQVYSPSLARKCTLGSNRITVTNTVAYSITELITTVKSFTVQTQYDSLFLSNVQKQEYFQQTLL